MKIAKAEITDKKAFNKIKTSLNRNSYVECGLCGAIRVEAYELARIIHSFIDRSQKGDDTLNDFCSDLLGQIIESAPDEFESIKAYEKWEAANEKRAYHFLDDDDYESYMYGRYDTIVVCHDLRYNCFSKEKIKEEIIVD